MLQTDKYKMKSVPLYYRSVYWTIQIFIFLIWNFNSIPKYGLLDSKSPGWIIKSPNLYWLTVIYEKMVKEVGSFCNVIRWWWWIAFMNGSVFSFISNQDHLRFSPTHTSNTSKPRLEPVQTGSLLKEVVL